MAPRILVCCVLGLALASCGENERGAASDGDPVAQMVVSVDPATACTELFGGPETARLRGRVRGRAVDARFARNNGCEIARWDNVAALLKAAG